MSLFVTNHLAYVAVPSEDWALKVIDVSIPTSPVVIGQTTNVLATDMDVSGKYLYIAGGIYDAEAYDISDPHHPKRASIIHDWSLGGNLYNVTVVGGYAYFADVGTGLHISDVRRPTSPKFAGLCEFSGWGGAGVAVSGHYAFCGGGGAGITVVDIADPVNPVLVTTDNLIGFAAYQIVISGSLIYAAASEDGLQIIDISNPTNVVKIGSYEAGGFGNWVAVQDGKAFLAGASGITVLDISNPAAPTRVHHFPVTGGVGQVRVDGNFIYAACFSEGFLIFALDPSLVQTPGILQHPINGTGVTGGAITFSVTADGAPPLNYSWLKDGVKLVASKNVSGVTSPTVTLTNLQSQNAGIYSVVVGNSYGSVTSSVAVLTVRPPPEDRLQVSAHGAGTVLGITNEQSIAIGKRVVPRVKPGRGYKLQSWLVQVDGVTVISTNKAIPFVMQSNLVITATFMDVQKPKLKVLAPKRNQHTTNTVFSISGTVKDNSTNGTVWYQLNGGGWMMATGWAIWSSPVALSPGSNSVQVYAVDADGNRSATNSVVCFLD